MLDDDTTTAFSLALVVCVWWWMNDELAVVCGASPHPILKGNGAGSVRNVIGKHSEIEAYS